MLTIKFIVCDDISRESISKQQTNNSVVILPVAVNGSNLSEVFNNEFLKTPRADLYSFFMPGDTFVDHTSVDKIVSRFKKEETGALYCDKYLIKDSNLIPQFYPPYEVESKFIYNPTLFINGGITTRLFDPNLEHLRFYDALKKIGSASKIIHIPQILMNSVVVSAKIDKELEYVWQTN